MAGPKYTQKQIAEKYKGNFDYFKKPHYYRRIRLWCFLIAVVGSVVGVASFRYWGKDDFLTTGPISANHARFASDCQVCHLGAEMDLLKTLPFSKSGDGANHAESASPGNDIHPVSLTEKGIAMTSLSLMDQACMSCHDTKGLHQPQAAGLLLKGVSDQISMVHATSCAVCHREHVGRDRMALPSSQTCASCHNNAEQLAQTRQLLKMKNAPISPTGEARDLGDGLVRFVPPLKSDEALKPFASYSDGHPPFGYEQPNLRDPANLKFNHARHERDDLPLVNNRKLDCADCHKPGADGVFYQRVTYEQNCQQCHSLQIQPNLPKLLIPHGDPQKVRYFLASLKMSFSEALRADGVAEPMERDRQTEAELQALRQRGLNSLEDLEERVFFSGDPKGDKNDRMGKGTARKFLTECAKCHTVSPGDAKNAPKIAPVNMTDRWVLRGPFTHIPHQHMNCADCHGEAHKSKLTSDILLPPQKLCAECHRPLDQEKVEKSSNAKVVSLKAGSHELAEAQRRAGGVKADCQTCHVFHAPPAATDMAAAEKGK